MNKKTLLILSLLLGVCLTFFACRKEIDNYLHDRTGPSSHILESAKVWRLQHLIFDKPNDALKPSNILKPHWDDSWQTNTAVGEVLLIVPTSEHYITNKDVTMRRFFIFTIIDGNVANGQIVELIGVKYDVTKNLNLLLANVDSKSIDKFNGSIIKYDINYYRLNSSTFEAGEKSNKVVEIMGMADIQNKNKKMLSQGISGNGKIMLNNGTNLTMTVEDCPYVVPVYLNFPTTYCENGYVTVEHTITYDPSTSCVLSESYRYLYQTCPGISTSNPGQGSGSGSGSGTGTSAGNPNYGGPGGSGGGTPDQIADTDFDWSEIADNEIIVDPNADEVFEPYQDGPWQKVTNVIGKDKFVAYRTVNGIAVNCLTLSKEMLAKKGYTCSGYLPATQTFQTFGENGVNLATTKKAITYMQSALAQGIPVLVGVDAFSGSSNADNVTDHFVVIVGSGVDATKGSYFNFYDSSTNNYNKGTSDQNRLYYNSTTGKITGATQTGYTSQPSNPGHDYIVTQVRKSIPKP